MKDLKQQPPTEILKAQRKDLYHVDVREIEVVDGFNVRTDYGDMGWLIDNIRENGVKNPVRAYKLDGKWHLIDGHRRHKACMILVDEGLNIRIPVVSEGKGVSAEQRIVDMICLNDGKRLNPLEEAEAINRLSNYGLSDTEISKKTSKTLVYISNLALLSSAPTKIKNFIKSEQISPTLVMAILREEDNFDNATVLIEKAYSGVVNGMEPKGKITKKDIDKAKNKTNSYSALKKSFKYAQREELSLRKGMETQYEFAQKIINGDYSREEIIHMFFENAEDSED